MSISWHCHTCFYGMPPAAVAGGIAVVIDVIRASTTITTAVANGAAGVFPVESVERARERASSLGEDTLLGGERGGIRIDGFGLGNSPREYTPERVAGHQIVFTTTNGTAALAACHEAAVVMIGCLVNRTAVAVAARAAAVKHQTAVHLVCAGVERQVAEEDLLGAGAILDAAADRYPHDVFDDAAITALKSFRDARGEQQGTTSNEALASSLADTPGGRRIVALGMHADLPIVAALDSLSTIPVLTPQKDRLLPLSS